MQEPIKVIWRERGRPRILTDEQARQLVFDYNDGMKVEALCEKYRMKRGALFATLKRLDSGT